MLARLIVGIAALAFAISTSAFTPRTGHWNNLNEGGSGYNIDIQDGVLVITVYSYLTNGAAQWYIASGNMTNGQHNFSGTLAKFTGGQCISCPSTVFPASAGDDGPISINFTSETSAVLTLPGGRTTTISPFNFKYGNPPQGLHGEWVYVENIGGAYFADHYNFTLDGAATSAGNGVVVDPIRFAACELQVTGVLAGKVTCFHWSNSSLTTVLDQYVYSFGLDETFAGLWVAPTSFNQYTMKGHLWVSSSGYSKEASVSTATPDSIVHDNQQKLTADQVAIPVAQGLEVGAAMAAIAQEVRTRLLSATGQQ